MCQAKMSTSAWPAPPPMPSRWKQNVACRSPVPSLLNTAQPHSPPRPSGQTDGSGLLQLAEIVTWYWARDPYVALALTAVATDNPRAVPTAASSSSIRLTTVILGPPLDCGPVPGIPSGRSSRRGGCNRLCPLHHLLRARSTAVYLFGDNLNASLTALYGRSGAGTAPPQRKGPASWAGLPEPGVPPS